jgi:hypothetical protein
VIAFERDEEVRWLWRCGDLFQMKAGSLYVPRRHSVSRLVEVLLVKRRRVYQGNGYFSVRTNGMSDKKQIKPFPPSKI